MTDDLLEARCRNCSFWLQGAPPIAVATRMPDPNPDLGVCQLKPPTIHVVGGAAISLFPAVHGDRSCWMWEPYDFPPDFPPGPRGGEQASNVVPMRDAA